MSLRLSRCFACFLCFSLLIAFFPMSAIRANSYDYETKVYTADEFKNILGTSLTGYQMLKNSDGTILGTENLTFDYFMTIPASGINRVGTTSTINGNTVFYDYSNYIGGSYLVYNCKIPDEIANQISSSSRFQCSINLNLDFDDVRYLQFGCGFAYEYRRDRQLRSDYTNNYLMVNGSAVRSPFYLNSNSYASFEAKVIPDAYNDLENLFPNQNLQFVQNIIDYDVNETSSFEVGSVVCDGAKLFNTNHLWFVILCPITNSDSQIDSVRPINNRDLKPIIQNTDDIKDLLEIIVSGSGASGLGKDDFVSLWVPSTAQLLTHEQSLRAMLHDTFGSAYEAEELLQDAVDAISEENVEPLTHLDLPALSVPVDGQNITIMQAQEVPLKPNGFDTLFTLIASIIDIVCTFAVINMLRKRFEKGVLENDG